MTTLLSATDLSLTYGLTPALRGVSVEVDAGEILAITGPSGSGKSSLLHCLCGLVTPDAGTVAHQGTLLSAMSDDARSRLRRTDFGVIFQYGQLLPELTALQNVMLPLMLQRVARSQADREARTWLDRLGLIDVVESLPGEMSGGQAQRVAVARALVTKPTVIFADEPTGSLDSVNGRDVLELLMSTARAGGAAVVLVTHDNRSAAHCDREIVLRDGEIDALTNPIEVTR
jgi:putative ABC transport system ATP-binding protein